MHLKASGLAFLCFAEDDSEFQGILLENSGHTYSLAGTPGKLPEGNFNECCFDTIPMFYTIEIAQSEDGKITWQSSLENVMRTGGDNCSLTMEESFDFCTDKLIIGPKADELIYKYFPERFLNKNCYVCAGKMNIDHVFPESSSM